MSSRDSFDNSIICVFNNKESNDNHHDNHTVIYLQSSLPVYLGITQKQNNNRQGDIYNFFKCSSTSSSCNRPSPCIDTFVVNKRITKDCLSIIRKSMLQTVVLTTTS